MLAGCAFGPTLADLDVNGVMVTLSKYSLLRPRQMMLNFEEMDLSISGSFGSIVAKTATGISSINV
jgi:hypothetical protein